VDGARPPRTEVRDQVCVLLGGSSPLVLYSEAERPGGLCVRGEAYVHGWMFGQAVEKVRRGELKTCVFELV
jgi:hypothetical protein